MNSYELEGSKTKRTLDIGGKNEKYFITLIRNYYYTIAVPFSGDLTQYR